MRLGGISAIVTGGASGLGRGIARAFAHNGASVAIVDKDQSSLDAVVAELKGFGGNAVGIPGDLTEEAFPARAVERTLEAFGSIDVLINNAGIGFRKPFLEITLQEWDRVYRTNLTSAFLMAQACGRVMVARGQGRIINMCSISGQLGSTGRAAYGSAKAALIQLTRIMAVELAAKGISVNAIAPGPIRTNLTNYGDQQGQAYVARIPERRMGTVDAVTAAAIYLAEPATEYVNGHVLNVDGGFTAAGLLLPDTDLHP